MKIGTQTQNVVYDENPAIGFEVLKKAGFDCCDFSLNTYLKNTDLYKGQLNNFFRKSEAELIDYFKFHKQSAKRSGITINQMHMPYPIYIHNLGTEINNFLWNEVAKKSLVLCKFFECKYLVIHGIKLDTIYSEEDEWKVTEKFIYSIAEYAKENNIVLCLENLYIPRGNIFIEGPACNAKIMAERIDMINEKMKAEVVGFCFDTGHANLVGIDNKKFITTLGHRLKVLHIHDNDGYIDLHQIPFTFTKTRENNSSTDWNGFINGLRNINFNGTFSFETAPVLKSFPDEMKEDVLKFIASIGRYFSDRVGVDYDV